jgi:hypothetical protein
MLAAALLIIATPIQPIYLDDLRIRRARSVDGERILVSLLVGKPPYTWNGSTIIGTDDSADGVERTAILKGNRLDLKEGRRVTVNGVLRVLDHLAQEIGTLIVPHWTDVRVEEER